MAPVEYSPARMSDSILYRAGTGTDVFHLGVLWHDFYEHLTRCGQAPAAEDGFAEWARPVSALVELGKLHLELAEEDGQLVGYVLSMLEAVPSYLSNRGQPTGFIKEVYTRPESRGRGVARTLIENTRSWFAAQGVSRMQLGVLAGNESARRFYERLGWEVDSVLLARDV